MQQELRLLLKELMMQADEADFEIDFDDIFEQDFWFQSTKTLRCGVFNNIFP